LNKFGAKKTELSTGEVFDSKMEAKRYLQLRALSNSGEILNLQRQVPFVLTVGETRVGRYVADFVYDQRIGSVFATGLPQFERVVEDVKGMQTPLFRWKAKHFEAQYGFPITLYPPRRCRMAKKCKPKPSKPGGGTKKGKEC
jgi:hypothetical protein